MEELSRKRMVDGMWRVVDDERRINKYIKCEGERESVSKERVSERCGESESLREREKVGYASLISPEQVVFGIGFFFFFPSAATVVLTMLH